MIAEPYICIKGGGLGRIVWATPKKGRLEFVDEEATAAFLSQDDNSDWRPYADFEREKLKELGATCVLVMNGHSDNGFYVYIRAAMKQGVCGGTCYYSNKVIGYDTDAYLADSESSRLLKRAEFLKAVCEKEGVEWLPKERSNCEDDDDCSCCKHDPATCEACGSANVHLDIWFGHAANRSGIKCRNCGYYTRFLAVPNNVCIEKPDRDYYTKAEIDVKLRDVDVWQGKMEMRTTRSGQGRGRAKMPSASGRR